MIARLPFRLTPKGDINNPSVNWGYAIYIPAQLEGAE